MSDISITAHVAFTPRPDLADFIRRKVGAAAFLGVEAWGKILFERSQELVAVDTGELKASGSVNTELADDAAVCHVAYDTGHASYVEFGTGIRGASSEGAGPYPYDPNWPGMVAQPYLRPALDETRSDGLAACQSAARAELA